VNLKSTDQEIDDFITAWKNDFYEVLTPEVARSELSRLLTFFVEMAKLDRQIAMEDAELKRAEEEKGNEPPTQAALF
jgi:hypothetical protein